MGSYKPVLDYNNFTYGFISIFYFFRITFFMILSFCLVLQIYFIILSIRNKERNIFLAINKTPAFKRESIILFTFLNEFAFGVQESKVMFGRSWLFLIFMIGKQVKYAILILDPVNWCLLAKILLCNLSQHFPLVDLFKYCLRTLR